MTSLGKYELHEQLGKGSFATVYRATDCALKREVALKVMHPQLSMDASCIKRFINEARLIAALNNPHIVGVLDLGESDGHMFIAMRYLSNGSLKQCLEQKGPLSFEKALEILKHVCKGLGEAHAKGFLHRDIKPANILFDSQNRAVVADFGLAHAMQQLDDSQSGSSGGLVGTPAYRAPELWRGNPPASPATDIYSLGCVFFEMLSGKVLFDGKTPDEIITQHLLNPPALPECFPAGVPGSIRAVIAKALAKQPEQRFQKTAEFARAAQRHALPESPVWKNITVPSPALVSLRGEIFELGESPVSIGRTSRNFAPAIDLSELDARQLSSRRHAQLILEDGGWCIQALATRNGTFINGCELPPDQKKALSNADIIQFGHHGVRLMFRSP